MTTSVSITRQRVNDNRRINHTAELFGIHFPLQLEPCVFNVTAKLSRTYTGDFAETCAAQYHLLRDFMLDHAEATGILRAID